MLKEFKEFVLRGNVMDLAVAVIIGAAFGKIVTSLVNDILMPIIGILLGGINFEDLKFIITPASGEVVEVAIRYGAFIQSMVDFLIIAVSIFVIIKLFTFRTKKEPEVAIVTEVPSKEELLLEEIRDILKTK
ncbi:large-conductance mechanosensitive channel protein MscL [Acetobacterium sp.]|uniref:large-conductance mechanosensitive channel protein MscL n=1 Tax=Acetobacterium sp. TaxID=1872094 RepID=UPI003593BB89